MANILKFYKKAYAEAALQDELGPVKNWNPEILLMVTTLYQMIKQGLDPLKLTELQKHGA